MRLSYDGIEFELLKIEDWTRTAIYDSQAGVDYLYDEHSITCVCSLNPGYTDRSRFPPAKPSGQPFLSHFGKKAERWNRLQIKREVKPVEQPAGVPSAWHREAPKPPADAPTGAASTLTELFRRLRQPRRELLIWTNSRVLPGVPGSPAGELATREYLLQSPLPGFKLDATGGPTCNVMQVIPVGGNASMCLRLHFETHLAASGPGGPVLLSNRWTFTTTAENDFAVHQISGEARFRADLLDARGMSADMFRKEILFPIPLGFRREKPTVTLMPSGDAVQYNLIDRQMPLHFPGGAPAALTRIEILERRGYETPNDVVAKVF